MDRFVHNSYQNLNAASLETFFSLEFDKPKPFWLTLPRLLRCRPKISRILHAVRPDGLTIQGRQTLFKGIDLTHPV